MQTPPTHDVTRLPARLVAALSALVLALALHGCGTGASSPAASPLPDTLVSPADGPPVQAWLTTGDRQRLLQADPPGLAMRRQATPTPVPPGAQLIDVDLNQRFQAMVGFGASITDASAWLISQRMTPDQRQALMQELFGRANGGLGFSLGRLTIGASDFSRHHYSLAEGPGGGAADMQLASFSLDVNRADVLPVVRQALAINPALQVMASPWSAPAWMKTTGSLVKGTLKPGMEAAFARYLVRYVDAMAAEGVPIFALTVQNEPHFEPDDYPGMRLDPAQRANLAARHLGPLLARHNPPVQLIDWDHNWDEPQSPLAVLADPAARPYIAGVGWHCYGGTFDAMGPVHDAHPDKDAWFTECSGGEWKTHWPETLPWLMRNIVIGTSRHWSRGALMWNLALDEKFGPHLGGCKDCRGVVTIDSRTGAVTRNMEYYVLGHASRFMRPGARRVASSAGVDGIDTVAFVNGDDGSVLLLVCNSAAAPRSLRVRQASTSFDYTVPRESIASFVWRP